MKTLRKLYLAGFFVAVFSGGVFGENLYVTPSGAGARNGSNWSNAFAGFGGIFWGGASGQLGAGDTLWISGGIYSSKLELKGSGTVGNLISIKRALGSDAEVSSSPGWLPSFDSQIVINEPSSVGGISETSGLINGPGRYVIVDGRSKDGIRINISDRPSARGIWFEGYGSYNTTIKYVGVYGPSRNINNQVPWTHDVRGVNINKGWQAGEKPSDITIDHCTISGVVTAIMSSSTDRIIFQNCDVNTIECNVGDPHANLVYISNSSNLTFRYNDFNNHLGGVGIFLTYFGGLSRHVWIYGNIFRDNVGTAQRSIEVRTESDGMGPIYIYNNTFYHVNQAININSKLNPSAQSYIRNNLFVDIQSGAGVNVEVGAGDYVTISDNHFTTNSGLFANMGSINIFPTPYDWQWVRDLHLISGSSPVNAGVNLGAPYDVDRDGNPRGADGTWDIGAYEDVDPTTHHYIRADAPAGGDGTTWTQAWTELPSTLQRGHVYYLADGSYPGRIFKDLSVGTMPITIRKAVLSNHGTDVGWNASFGDGQAIFTSASGINAAGSDYWVFDGQQGDYYGNVPYGLAFVSDDPTAQVFNLTSGGHHSIFRYVEFAGHGRHTTGDFAAPVQTAALTAWGGAAHVFVQHCYLHGAATLMDAVSNWTIEYCVLKDSRGDNNPAGAHSNVFYCGYGAHDIVFRYNIISNFNDEGFFITGYNGSPYNIYAYGNIFYSPNTRYSRAFEFRQDFNYRDIYIMNNTIVNMTHSGINNNTALTGNSTVNCRVENNLLYNAGMSLGDISYQSSNVVAPSNPFVNVVGNDFRLSSPIAGTILSAPFGIDRTGISRGSDGVWDIGAYEFCQTGNCPFVQPPPLADPQAPTIFAIQNQITNQDTPTSSIAFTVADADTPLANLDLSAVSSNQTLVANSGIVFGGSGADRTVTITPQAGRSGTTTITISITDGLSPFSRSFTLTVIPSSNTDQSGANSETGFLPFTNVFNPLKDSLRINLSAVSHDAKLTVYDKQGSEVRTLDVSGSHADWDGRNSSGQTVASGTYLVVLKQGDKVQQRKVVVVK